MRFQRSGWSNQPGADLGHVLNGRQAVLPQGGPSLYNVQKDTILEQGKRFYEVLDLGFGRCRPGPK